MNEDTLKRDDAGEEGVLDSDKGEDSGGGAGGEELPDAVRKLSAFSNRAEIGGLRGRSSLK